jgi:hypothetical protein
MLAGGEALGLEAGRDGLLQQGIEHLPQQADGEDALLVGLGGPSGAVHHPVVGQEKKAQQPGRQRLLSDPSGRGEPARVGGPIAKEQRRVQPVQRGKALVPSARDELLGSVDIRSLPEAGKPVGVPYSSLLARVLAELRAAPRARVSRAGAEWVGHPR